MHLAAGAAMMAAAWTMATALGPTKLGTTPTSIPTGEQLCKLLPCNYLRPRAALGDF